MLATLVRGYLCPCRVFQDYQGVKVERYASPTSRQTLHFPLVAGFPHRLGVTSGYDSLEEKTAEPVQSIRYLRIPRSGAAHRFA
jgi:hypothetical protein